MNIFSKVGCIESIVDYLFFNALSQIKNPITLKISAIKKALSALFLINYLFCSMAAPAPPPIAPPMAAPALPPKSPLPSTEPIPAPTPL